MLKAHVWLPFGNMVGHASISFRDVYVSFWPDGCAGAKDLKFKRSHPSAFVSALNEDIHAEGGRTPTTIVIEKYNENKLSQFILNLKRNMPRYQIAKYNCSHVVAECLRVACEEEPSFYPTAHNYGKMGKVLGRGIWTPHEILRYAEELASDNKVYA